ncbi:MAG: VWA domain-containing protein, partial [Chloroflexi bacterium]|nr:VWA domain-containing protein [Chloroflexota bacterium]
PSVFAVHFGAAGDEATSTAIMQDLARANGGFYQYATATGEVDRAFDRMATWLRRPASYTFSWSAAKLPPGSIALTVAQDAQVRIGGVAVALVLDTSTSMNEKAGGQTRITVAKQSLRELVSDSLPDGLSVSLRVFKPGTRKRQSCDTRIAVALGPLDKAAMLDAIAGLRIRPRTSTPLAAAIEAAGRDIEGAVGPRIVVVVTDGNESCKGDPAAAVHGLIDQGFETTVNIVGLGLDDQAVKDQMAEWAAIGGGVFVDAQDRASLSAGIAQALRAPFQVFDADGTLVGAGLVDGDFVTVEPGRYRVEISSEPPIVFEAVEVAPGQPTQLEIGGPTE